MGMKAGSTVTLCFREGLRNPVCTKVVSPNNPDNERAVKKFIGAYAPKAGILPADTFVDIKDKLQKAYAYDEGGPFVYSIGGNWFCSFPHRGAVRIIHISSQSICLDQSSSPGLTFAFFFLTLMEGVQESTMLAELIPVDSETHHFPEPLLRELPPEIQDMLHGGE